MTGLRARLSPFRQYLGRIDSTLDGFESVLDIGCGTRSPTTQIARRPARLVGLDTYQPAIDASSALGRHDEYLVGDALGIAAQFGPDTFDAVVGLDIIEHFDKQTGFDLLTAMETVARRRVVVFTTNGYVPQAADDNEHQEHLSGWHPDDFELQGYKVTGHSGLRVLAGEKAKPKVKPERLGLALMGATEMLVRTRPRYAYALLAVKDL